MTRPPLPDTDADDVLRKSLQPLVQAVGAHPSPQAAPPQPEFASAIAARKSEGGSTNQVIAPTTESRPPIRPTRTPLHLGSPRRTPPRRERALTVEVPQAVRQALRLRAAQDDITERVLVLRALRAFGLPVAEEDLIDRRQFNGARRIETDEE